MVIKLNRSEEILARLQKEGKSKVLDDDPEFLKRMKEIEKRMEEVRRESRIIAALSWMDASTFIITS